jgi:hypothetical protein
MSASTLDFTPMLVAIAIGIAGLLVVATFCVFILKRLLTQQAIQEQRCLSYVAEARVSGERQLKLLESVRTEIDDFDLKKKQQELDAEEEQGLVSFDGPMQRLTFEQSLNPDDFALAIRESGQQRIGSLMSYYADGITLTVNTVRLVSGHTEMLVRATKAGKEIATGIVDVPRVIESGARLPLVRNVETGKIVELMKESRTATTISRAANLAAAVTSVAHLISGADLAVKLKRVEGKLDSLLAGRRSDQLARLETIFSFAKELTHPENRLVGRREQLWTLRSELHELRTVWRHELEHHLAKIEDPKEADFFRRFFSRTKSIDRDISGRISHEIDNVGLISYSLRLDQLLAYESDTLPMFLETLRGELNQFQALADTVQTKASFISGRYPELTVKPTVDALTSMVEGYRTLLPREEKLLHPAEVG